MFRRFLPALLAVGYLAAVGQAAKVKVWSASTPAHYEKAQLKGVVISNEGTVRLARELRPLVNLDATHVWDIAVDSRGNLYAATGDEGKLYRVTPEGQASVVFESEDSQVLCLAVGPDGCVYAGTGPGGRVVRVAPDGTARVFFETGESYVWSLAMDPSGKIYAGTGPKGRIYQVTSQGKGSLFYATKQEHILCLALGADGTLYAGTDKNGLVYRFDEQGKAFVLYHAPQAEVHSLLVTPTAIYAGTSSPRRKASSLASAGLGRPLVTDLAALSLSTSKQEGRASSDESSGGASPVSSSAEREEKTASTPAPHTPVSGENSVYRIGADGSVREVFREKTLILSLLEQKGRLLVGTGMEGQLFEVDPAGRERSELARLDHGQIHALRRRADGSIVLGTGDPGRLYVLQDKHLSRGTVLSEVLDARLISQWGAIRWQADTPPGTRLTIAIRSGNIAEPDETWSEWSAELSDPDGSSAALPAARFLQYRVSLTTQNPERTPALRRLSVRYKSLNQAPEVTSIDVPDLDGVNLENPKRIKLKWQATDPNEDDLTYRVYARKEGWKNWILLEENLDRKEFEWDTTTAPSGIYRVKIVASDRPDNPDEEALTGERVSTSFAVAHEPPTVTVKVAGVEGEHALFEATATDPLVRLTGAACAINGKSWTNLFPVDGVFDSKTESFRFKSEALKPGSYVLVLKVKDAAGNTGSADVVFSVREPSSKP